MDEVVIDEWSVVAYAKRQLPAEAVDEVRRRVEDALVASVSRLSGTLDPAVMVRVEQ